MSGNTGLLPETDSPEFDFEDEASGSTTDAAEIPESATLCPSCNVATDWQGLSYCPACGYYPKANSTVDISQPDDGVVVYNNILEAVPEWVWTLLSITLAIAVLNVFFLLLIPDPVIRGWLTISEMLAGFCGFGYFHWKAYLKSLKKDDGIGVVDFIVNPREVWRPTFEDLPETSNEVGGAGGMLAMLILAPAICGGYDFFAFIESMAPKEKPRTSLVAAIAEASAKMDKSKTKSMGASNMMEGVASAAGTSNMTMEEALDEFSEEAVGDMKPEDELQNNLAKAEDEEELGEGDEQEPGLPKAEKPATTPEELRPKLADCVIIGFRLTPTNDLDALVVASDVNYSLHYVGVVSAKDMTSVEKSQIKSQISRLYRRRKVVPTSVDAHWLEPKLTCRVRFKKWTNSKKLVDPIFEELLDASVASTSRTRSH